MSDEEDATRQRFLIGCLVLVFLLAMVGVWIWTPLPGLLVMWKG